MKLTRLAGAGLALLLLCAGCDAPSLGLLPPQRRIATHAQQEAQLQLEAGLDAQLGLLADHLSPQERAECMQLWAQLWPARQARLAAGTPGAGDREARQARRLRKLLDQLTVQYLDGDPQGFAYEDPPLREVAAFTIQEGQALEAEAAAEEQPWSQEDLAAMWEEIRAILPPNAFADFARFEIFTDGPEETLAYVYYLDAHGARWALAVDPADADEGGYFTETILHEYFHYLSLNDDQVRYTPRQTVDTYNETGMVSLSGSYLDDFYQAFWTDYLDDCLAGPDTYNFFLRHYDDFVSAYASTDPSEDICESFAYFVLWDRGPAGAVWEQKLEFFYDYPELVALRMAVRENLGLSAEEGGFDAFSFSN